MNLKLTKRAVDAAHPRAERYDLWDADLPGFALRIAPSGKKTFFLRYRPKGGGPKRFMTLGHYGPITPSIARQRATELLGRVAGGEDPVADLVQAHSAYTVSQAIEEFLSQHVTLKRKPNTGLLYRHILSGKVVPALGHRKLSDVTKADVARFHHSLRSTPVLANRTLAALGSLYSWASNRGLIAEGLNPTQRMQKYPERRRERYLSPQEMRRLGDALRQAESVGIPWKVDINKPTFKHAAAADKRHTLVSPFATAAIRLLFMTGCRLREILHLRWTQVDFERGILRLPDTKTGSRHVLLGGAALAILAGLPRIGPFVFPGQQAEKPRTDLKRPWAAIQSLANLPDVRLHDLRHSYASVGAGSGLGLPILGKLLGHTQPSTTARYAHLADDPLRRASESITAEIGRAMGEI